MRVDKMPNTHDPKPRQTPVPVSFSYEQINLLREVLRELLNSGISRSEIARKIGTTPSLVTNFVRLVEPTKRPNHNRFLVPLFNYVVENLHGNSANPKLHKVVELFIESVSHILTNNRPVFRDIIGQYKIFMRLNDEITISYMNIGDVCNLKIVGPFSSTIHYDGDIIKDENPILIFFKSDHSGFRAISITAELPFGSNRFSGIAVFSGKGSRPTARKILFEKCAYEDKIAEPRIISESDIDPHIEKILSSNYTELEAPKVSEY